MPSLFTAIVRFKHKRLYLFVLFVLCGATLACNLTAAAQVTPEPTESSISITSGSPTVSVMWPPNNSEFVVQDEVTVHVSAEDSVGITRIELRSPSMMLSSVPSPERNGQPSMEAILSWHPTRAGQQTVEVVAYRRSVASEPMPLTLIVRQRTSDIIATPLPFGTTDLGIIQPASNTACQVRVDIGNLRFRSGPSTNNLIMGILELGETLNVTGMNSARTWYQISRSGQTAWVSANPSYSTELSSCAGAPVVQ